MTTPRKRRPRLGWIVLLGIAVALIIGAIAAALILQRQGGAAPASPTPSATAGDSGGGAGANGCLAGPGITAEQLEEIRAGKDLTPTGAVEFLGAFRQFTSAGDPNYRAGIEGIVREMTADSAKKVFGVASSSTAPSAGKNHATDLSQAYYRVVSADTKSVVVDIFSIEVENGAPVAESEGQYYYGGGSFTLIPSDAGWVITDATDSTTLDEVRSTGYRFEGGC